MEMTRQFTSRVRVWPVALAVLTALGAFLVASPAASARPPHQINPTVSLSFGPEQPLSYQIHGAGFGSKGAQIVIQTLDGTTVQTVNVRTGGRGTFTYDGTTGSFPDCAYNAYVTDVRTGAQATPYPLEVVSWVCTA